VLNGGIDYEYYGISVDRSGSQLCFDMIAMIVGDHRRSQGIEHGSIFCGPNRSQTIADACFHMIVDRRTHDSAIIWKPEDRSETTLHFRL